MAVNVGFGDDPTIPKLMGFLKTAFQPRHFDDVQEILINREEKLKVEIQRLKEENDGLRLDKVAIEAENEKLKRKLLEEMHNEPIIMNNIEAGLTVNDTVPENGNCNDMVPNQTDAVPKADLDDSQAGSKGLEDRVCIEISDSDDDPDSETKSAQTSQSKRVIKESGSVTLKRKQESEARKCCTDDNTESSKRVCHPEQMAVEKTSMSNMSEFVPDNIEDSDGFSCSDSDHFVDKPYNQKTLINTRVGEDDPIKNPIDESSIPSASIVISNEVEIPRFNPVLSEEQHFECGLTTKCDMKIIANLIKTELKDDKTNLNLFLESPFGHLLDVSDHLKPALQVMWALLVREADIDRTSEMWFLVNGIPVRFSLMEYALITGLNCSQPPTDMGPQFKSTSFRDKHFRGQDGIVTLDDLKAKFKTLVAQHKKSKRRNDVNWEIIKMASLLFVTAVLMRRDRSSSPIDKKWLGLVDNLDLFNKYPWGFVSFEYLLKQLRRKDLKAKAKVHQRSNKEISITYAGFFFPLTVLTFECLPALATEFAGPRHDIDQTLPRICRWKMTCTRSPNYTAVKEAIGVSKDVKTLLYPSEEESNLPHIQGISVPKEQRPNRILEKMVEVLERGGSIAFPFEQTVVQDHENVRMAQNEEVYGETEVHNDDRPPAPQNVGTSKKVEFSCIKKYLDERTATVVESLKGEMNDQLAQMLKVLSNRNEPSEKSNAEQRRADPNIAKSFGKQKGKIENV